MISLFFKILKRDLKRKKTMNLILLIFVLLAATFISSSVNNMVSILSATDRYVEMAKIPDFYSLSIEDKENSSKIDAFFNSSPYVKSFQKAKSISISKENIIFESNPKYKSEQMLIVCSFGEEPTVFFDENNKPIQPSEGEVYVAYSIFTDSNLKEGDKLTLSNSAGTYKKTFTVKGYLKDALLGSSLMTVKRLVITEADFNELYKNSDMLNLSSWYVSTNDVEKLSSAYTNFDVQSIFDCTKSFIGFTYVMDMILAGILVIVSFFLILISLLVLRFTVNFTIIEEFREIGIMKAIGFRNTSIRTIYITKYFGITIVGALLGFIISIPFGRYLLESVSKNMVINSLNNTVLINLLCSILILVIVVGFCYMFTRKINKMSVMDAIRNGSSGERYKTKGILKLSRFSKIRPVFFMALNDILSEFKKFVTLFITFTLGVVIFILPMIIINTLIDDSVIKLYSITQSDVYFQDDNRATKYIKNSGNDYVKNDLNDLQKELASIGINSSICAEVNYSVTITNGSVSKKVMGLRGVNTISDEYTYLDGKAPKYENEIAITEKTATALKLKLGDSVKVTLVGETRQYIITAFYQSMFNMGEGIRFSENAKLDCSKLSGLLSMQLKFPPDSSDEQKNQMIQKLKSSYPDITFYDVKGFISSLSGGVIEQFQSLKIMLLILVMFINILVTVLMVRSFISKEKGEIAIMKSIGFNNTSVIMCQTSRIGLIMLLSTIMGAIISTPLNSITGVKLFELFGLTQVEFAINPIEIYIVYPLIFLAGTVVATFITSLGVRKITPQQANNIE